MLHGHCQEEAATLNSANVHLIAYIDAFPAATCQSVFIGKGLEMHDEMLCDVFASPSPHTKVQEINADSGPVFVEFVWVSSH